MLGMSVRKTKRLFSSSSLYRLARKQMSTSDQIKRVSIEGNIAVGKSTFARLLQKTEQDWEVIAEPIGKWQNVDQTTQTEDCPQSTSNLLQMMYHDPKRWSYTFQTFSCMSRMRSHLQPLSAGSLKSSGSPVRVYERSVYSDRFPIHNPERLNLWLLALHLDINTPDHALICKRVCSDHFFDDDYTPSQQGDRRFLKASAVPYFLPSMAVPNTFLQQTEYPSRGNLESLVKAELEVQEAGGFWANVPQSTPVKQEDSDPGTTTRHFSDVPSKLLLMLTSPERFGNRKTPSSSGIYFAHPAIHSHQSPPVYNQPEQMEEKLEDIFELDVSLLSKDPPSDKKDLRFQPLSSTSTSTTSTEEDCEMHWKQKKWIVNEPNVMELFKRCQECGSVITKTSKATVGSVLRVHWECEKNHKGQWSSCSDVRGMPDNNLLVSACTLFSGATYTDIARH